ncbi:MAG: FeoA family protein [Candidatus Omnitrophica bacterium]|nr:FeoA family protein [Candidatus Omnitrophota bacterium]
MKKLSLIKLKKNTKARVLEISGGGNLQHKMMSMGIYPGKEITKVSHFALRGPVTVKVGRSLIALGHSMAAKILLEKES